MTNPTLTLKFKGVSRLLCHNGELADGMSHYAKLMKAITSKKKKVDADHDELAKLEFFGSLYQGKKGEPVLPSEMIEACIINGAKKTKQGPTAKAGLLVPQPAPILYDGPKTKEKLWADDRFRLRTGVRIGQQKVMRTRPMFPDWAVEVVIEYSAEITTPEDILAWATIAGQQVGLGDWRPRYGRFVVEQIKAG